VRKLSGLTKYGNITLKWGLTIGGTALDLFKWHADVSAGQIKEKRKKVVIVVQDEAGADAARFVVTDAWPIKYDPKARKYHAELDFLPPALMQRVVEDSKTLVRALGYDMNSIEWAVRDGVPYAIDFMNPAPDMDIYSLTPTHFEWVVSSMADMAIRFAKEPPKPPKPSWENFLKGRQKSKTAKGG